MARILAMLLAGALLAAPASLGQGKGKGKGKHRNAEVRFSVEEAGIITGYYAASRFPPGIEKQLRRKGRLPPGLQKKMEPFPQDLVSRLPPPPQGYHRGVVGKWAVLVHDATNVVFDIIDLARSRR